MKGDLPPAAMRLSAALTVRTHEAREPGRGALQSRGPALDALGRMTSRKAIRINSVEYASMSDARKALGCSFQTLHRMVAAGTAELV